VCIIHDSLNRDMIIEFFHKDTSLVEEMVYKSSSSVPFLVHLSSLLRK